VADVLLDRVGRGRQDDDAVRVPGVAYREQRAKTIVILEWVLRDVGFERDARPFEENDFVDRIVSGRVLIVGVVDRPKYAVTPTGFLPAWIS
jgi:hypothetical protein